MKKSISGSALKYGDNINTDIISPPQYMELGIKEASYYAMSSIDPDFSKKCRKDTILVAGVNFGSGSSRETSPLSLKYLGVQCIIARFFARIFYRNAINLGMILVECADADKIRENDQIEVDFEKGIIHNLTTEEHYECSQIPEHIMQLIQDGGLVENIKKSLRQSSSGR